MSGMNPTTVGRARLENGLDVRFLRAGEGGPAGPLVLLHGMPQHAQMWRRVLPSLATAGFDVIAPDQRGAGGTTMPRRGGYTKAELADDLALLLAALGIPGPVSLAGYDLGAGVAYAFAAAHPERVRQVAFLEFGLPGFGYERYLAPSPDWSVGSNWHLSLFTLPDVAVQMLAGKERELLSWFFWHLSYDHQAIDAADFDLYVRELSRPGALRAMCEWYAAAALEDGQHNTRLLAERGKLTMPVLAVGGERSAGACVAELFRPVAEDVTGAVVERAGHWLADENPDGLAAVLLDFFGKGRQG
jgi:pimeloyl-ACP methyl ester carboxylesterase